MRYTMMFITALFFCSAIGMAAETETKKISLNDVDTLIFSGDIEVNLKADGGDEAIVEFDKSEKENIRIEVDGNKFIVEQKKSFWAFWKTQNAIKISVSVAVKKVVRIDISESVKIQSKTINTDDLVINGSGASYLKFQELNADKLDVRLSGASKLIIENTKIENFFLKMSGSSVTHINGEGNINHFRMSASGSCHYIADKIITSDAKVEASGALVIELNVQDNLQANLTGASRLIYSGSPETNIQSTGANKISTF